MVCHLFPNCQEVTWTWDQSKKNFLQNTKNLVLDIWFWSTFNKKHRINCDITRDTVSKFVELGGKNRKIKVIQQVITWIYPWIFFYQKWFFLRVLKSIFKLTDIFQLQLFKKQSAIITRFFKKYNLRSILVVCGKLSLMKIKTVIC